MPGKSNSLRYIASACIGALSCLAFVTTPCLADQHVVVVLDDSGSMDDPMRTAQGQRVRRIEAAKTALVKVLSNLPENTQVGILALNSKQAGSNWIVPFGQVTDSSQLIRNVTSVQAQGGTPLGAFLKQASDQLLDARQKSVYGTYRLLVVTDGEANDRKLVDAYLPDILSRGLIVDVIGVDMKSDHSLATRVHTYKRADDDQALTEAITQVFAETADDGQNSGEEFEILAGLPDEFGPKAIAALTERNDTPIAKIATNEFTTTRVTGQAGKSLATAAIGLMCCAGSFVGLTFLIGAMVFFIRQTSRHRRQ